MRWEWGTTMKNILLATTLVGAMTAHANAMTFATYTTSNGAQGARLSGELVHGDADRFAANHSVSA